VKIYASLFSSELDFDSDCSSVGNSYEKQFLSGLASIPDAPLDLSSGDKQERRSSLTKDGTKDEKAGRKALLQKFIETQMHSVVTSLHEEVRQARRSALVPLSQSSLMSWIRS
jgi:hypothetical protein